MDVAENFLTSLPVSEIAKLPFAFALGALGLATGNLTNGITGLMGGRRMIGNAFNNFRERNNVYRFGQDYQNLTQQIYQGRDNNWIRDHLKALLNGDVSVQQNERDLYDLLIRERDRYINSGYSNDDAINQIDQNVAGVQSGQFNRKPRLFGFIPRELINRTFR